MEEKLLDEITTKPIGFPISMLKIVDTYALENNKSRAEVVRQAMKEFIVNHNLG